LGNVPLCREHFRLTLRVEQFPAAHAGQFVHLRPEMPVPPMGYRTWESDGYGDANTWAPAYGGPMLRRAFSIAGFAHGDETTGIKIDLIYRVVGTGTQWMASLNAGDRVSVLGPLGKAFPISNAKPAAWLVAGGVGLPPMLWLAEELHRAGKRVIAFCGAQTADLLPLTIDPAAPPATDAKHAVLSCPEFTAPRAPIVISTDDGSLGYHGHIGAAMPSYHAANPIGCNELVVYTCGPERMMRFVAEYCMARGIECHVCMERSMGCGTGMCQSCVVPVRDENDADGWSYRLCCTEGPVFDAASIIWERTNTA
jgi:dihydroorotate dehydrogenase electron transfer subunit